MSESMRDQSDCPHACKQAATNKIPVKNLFITLLCWIINAKYRTPILHVDSEPLLC
ncbi:hypothetical protein JCM10003_3751 [Bacteroides pyogenes JCM 10003]|nr:hypothetical protein JCM10003_3751 [Bacteroides pyogenes JCM 10003]